jgi:hypothetical protein
MTKAICIEEHKYPGIKVICIKEHKYRGIKHLTIGKIYDLKEYPGVVYYYYVLGDNNDNMALTLNPKHYYVWDYFKSIADWRNEQIDSILKDD